jgi:hypothetical protein
MFDVHICWPNVVVQYLHDHNPTIFYLLFDKSSLSKQYQDDLPLKQQQGLFSLIQDDDRVQNRLVPLQNLKKIWNENLRKVIEKFQHSNQPINSLEQHAREINRNPGRHMFFFRWHMRNFFSNQKLRVSNVLWSVFWSLKQNSLTNTHLQSVFVEEDLAFLEILKTTPFDKDKLTQYDGDHIGIKAVLHNIDLFIDAFCMLVEAQDICGTDCLASHEIDKIFPYKTTVVDERNKFIKGKIGANGIRILAQVVHRNFSYLPDVPASTSNFKYLHICSDVWMMERMKALYPLQ